jgi:hypothetical protein
LAGDAANGKPLIASRTLNPPKAAGSFIKSVSSDFMKNGILCACGEKGFHKAKLLRFLFSISEAGAGITEIFC